MADRSFRFASLLVAFAAFGAVMSYSTVRAAEETALDRYVARPDPVFAWKLASRKAEEGYTTYILELTSQTWRSDVDVDRPVWKHWISLVKPNKAAGDTAFLYIGGGSNRDAAPEVAPDRVVSLALGTNSVVAELGQVPNQPLFFNDSRDEGRSEDNLIAYTRVKYIATRDGELAGAAGHGQKRRARHGRHPAVFSDAGRGRAEDRTFCRSRRVEARLDNLARRSGRQSRDCDHPDRDRRAQLGADHAAPL